ncbi:MAG: Ig-like domain-containing protein [Gemmatimonadetes bacterium]|nr:Ig-like domain-containing protein [Gemmatimonadota bacterium]MBI3569127.1 Ig-like domain-containing protein [Gemmatimonadota bacterium]
MRSSTERGRLLGVRMLPLAAVAAALGACGGGGGGDAATAPKPPANTPTLTSIALSITASSISVGGTAQLTATPRDQNGNAMTAAVTYASSATGVATVSTGGLVSGVAAGTALITAASGSVSNSVSVSVTAATFPASAIVTTPGNAFAPFQVDIASGGTVQWQFGSVGHNVVFDGTAGAPAGIVITSNANVSRTFAVKGTFNYQCTVHAGMVGVVVVH